MMFAYVSEHQRHQCLLKIDSHTSKSFTKQTQHCLHMHMKQHPKENSVWEKENILLEK